MHLNRSKTRKIRYNTLRNFPLQGFNKHIHRFGCSGKWEHLNRAERQNPAANPLTTNVLHEFQKLHPWFRSLAGQECRGMQMCPEDASGRGIHQTRNRTAHASEPRQNLKNPLQLIEKLFIAKFKQESHLVQMQRKMGASEPCCKAESNSQPTHSKRVVRPSAITPVVQIPSGSGMPRNANVPWRHFCPKGAAEQHMHLNRSKTRKIHCNTLRNFPLHGLSKHLPWFRCRAEEKKQKITFLRGITL